MVTVPIKYLHFSLVISLNSFAFFFLTNFSFCLSGVSAAMNELRPCAPLSLKHVLAQELVKGLQAVSDSLVGYNATRLLRENESALFLSLCRAYIEVSMITKFCIHIRFRYTLAVILSEH